MKNRHYLNWVKSRPCVVCADDTGVDPHHIAQTKDSGMGMKVTDFWAIPLCREHHDDLHSDVEAWELAYGSQWEHVAKTIKRAIFEGELICPSRW